MSLITTDLWQQRTQAAADFTSAAELSGGRGLPIVTCQRWGESIRIEPPVLSRVNAVEKSDGWEYELATDQKLRYREVPTIALPDGTKYEPELGALRVDFTCDRKPADNVFPLKLTLPKGAELLYQPKLTQTEIDEGYERPDWCVDSWAVYCDARKLGHIPRPWARDADGKWTWGTWQRNELAGTLAKVIPQAWLDTAKYPILIDDTFGFTSAGGSPETCYDAYVYACQPFSDPAGNGTADSISAWTKYTLGENLTFGIYDDSSGPNNLLTNGATNEIAGSSEGTAVLETATFPTGPSIVASTQYYLGYWHDGGGGNNYLMYDAGSETIYYKSGQTYSGGTMPNPFPESPGTYGSKKFSIYCTYTPSGGGVAPTGVLSGSLVGPFGGPI